MLATLVEPYDEVGWQYEIKWDGYRAVARMNNNKFNLLSRNNKSFNEKFYPVYEAIMNWGIQAVVDGEIVVLNDHGKPDFGALQNWRSEADGQIMYYVFDLVWLEGYNLMKVPLKKRREILLKSLPKKNSIIRMSETFESTASELLKAVHKMGMEGIMAKKENSLYIPGIRTKEWLKMKSGHRHEVVIGGYTRNEGSGKAFSSLLVGVFARGKLHYTGKIGTGFSDQLQKEMMQKFKPFIRKTSPFSEKFDVNKPSRFRPDPPNATVIWLKPGLVCEVSYTEMTADGVMRHPSFEGMREDKKASEVHAEKAVPAKKMSSLKI